MKCWEVGGGARLKLYKAVPEARDKERGTWRHDLCRVGGAAPPWPPRPHPEPACCHNGRAQTSAPAACNQSIGNNFTSHYTQYVTGACAGFGEGEAHLGLAETGLELAFSVLLIQIHSEYRSSQSCWIRIQFGSGSTTLLFYVIPYLSTLKKKLFY